MYIWVLLRCMRNNYNTYVEAHKHELTGLLVGGIRDKWSHKWSKNKPIRKEEERRVEARDV